MRAPTIFFRTFAFRHIPNTCLLLLIFCFPFLFASVKPNFQLTGNSRSPVNESDVKISYGITAELGAYDIIGLMSDCSSLSTYVEFIKVFKKEAAKYGANYMVVNKTRGTNESAMDGGLCVEATAIYVHTINETASTKPIVSEDSQCVQYLKEIIRLKDIIDSLRTIINERN